MRHNKVTFFIVVILIAAITYVAFWGIPGMGINGADKMRYGIDINGGVDAVFKAKDGASPSDADLDKAKTIMETRLDNLMILDRDVIIDKQYKRITVRFPWKSGETEYDSQKAITELGDMAELTFRNEADEKLVFGKDVAKSTVEYDNSTRLYVVSLEFNEAGTAAFAAATSANVGKPLSIYMDDVFISAPNVQEAITGGKASISSSEFKTQAAAKALSDKINAGSLPYAMVSDSNNVISPTLGANALKTMVLAGIIAFILVCLFMLFYYRLPGFVACIALLLQVAGQLAALSIPQVTLTLPGIAGIILSIGMGVDANIIVSERLKEEMNTGKTLSASVSAGFHKAFSSVFDGNITVIIVAVVMMVLGSGAMWSFGYTLLIGVLLNFLAGVTATRLMIGSLSKYDFLKNPVLYGARRAK